MLMYKIGDFWDICANGECWSVAKNWSFKGKSVAKLVNDKLVFSGRKLNNGPWVYAVAVSALSYILKEDLKRIPPHKDILTDNYGTHIAMCYSKHASLPWIYFSGKPVEKEILLKWFE